MLVMAELLSEEEIAATLAMLTGWERIGRSLVRSVKLPTFPDAIALVDKVAVEAERANHHPDIDIRWRTVTFICSTHSKGGITTLDVALAQTIDELVAGREQAPPAAE
jgi:4a-hydroxytetrahydrobiopterin dehydratase